MNYQVVKFRDLDKSIVKMLGGARGGSFEFKLHNDYPINIPFNKVVYMKHGKKLMAVKYLMATYISTDIKNLNQELFKLENCYNDKGRLCGWYYLMQTPYGTEWMSIDGSDKTRLFYSKEEYFKHLENGYGGFEIKYDRIGMGTYSFKETWKWNGHCAEKASSYIKNLIITEDGLSVVLVPCCGEYYTKEECIRANVEGMQIIEFPPTESVIKVSIEVVKNPPIVKTISFVEE